MTAVTEARGSWPARLRSGRFGASVALALPFAVTVAALRGMHATLPVFHGSDERVYHYPTVLRFASQLPFPDLHNYHAAQTPLFHLLMAYAGKLVGLELWRLRLLEVLISYLLALAFFHLLERRLDMARVQALALTLLFVLSPYVFGTAFRLLTDNLALLFVVLAVERFERFRESERSGPFLAGCVWVAAAVLTRQSAAFLFGVAALYALRPGAALSLRERALALAAIGVSAIPAGLLFLSWHGLVPPGGDPGSCGLCAAGRAGSAAQGLRLQTAELALATIGLYGAVMFAPEAIRRLHASRSLPDRGLLLAAAAGLVLLVVFPARPGSQAAGVLWKVAGHLPVLLGSSLLFWLLVPLSGAVIAVRGRVAPRPWLFWTFLAGFLISTLVIRLPWQKYVDPFALLVLIVSVRPRELIAPRQLAGVAVLMLAFLAYTLDFSAHRDTARTAAAARPGGVYAYGARARARASSRAASAGRPWAASNCARAVHESGFEGWSEVALTSSLRASAVSPRSL